MKKIIKVIKKIIFAAFLIFGFNMLYGTFKMNIPFNVYTVSIVTLLGLPGFCAIIFISLVLY